MKPSDIKKIVKEKYQKIARSSGGCGCSCQNQSVSKNIGYSNEELQTVGQANMGLGCGNPIALSKIKEGDVVVDLGSGAGIDCILASKKVGSAGKVIGIDMTEEMIAKAEANVKNLGLFNIEFMLSDIEDLPLNNESADVIISNCVINLAPDKLKVFIESNRILKPGGRMYVSDIVLLKELSEIQSKDKELISGCVAGALLKEDYINKLSQAGFKINILSENKDISKEQYQAIPLESIMIEAIKQ
ncbi:arsenite methyltransferase [Patescibacteria group bacterium]|nr:arsenite methyltransferase [Patescibacteria group bacterium]